MVPLTGIIENDKVIDIERKSVVELKSLYSESRTQSKDFSIKSMGWGRLKRQHMLLFRKT